MIDLAGMAGFAAVVAPLVVTPGASFTLVSARGLVGDHRGAWATIAGTAAGIMTHAVLAGIGLATLVMQSAQLYAYIRVIGALYLIGLGLSLVLRSTETPRTPVDGEERAFPSLWAQGQCAYLANVLNVKPAMIYLSLAPQFIGASDVGVVTMARLGLAHILVAVVWLGLWATGLTTLADRYNPRNWRRWINAAGGTVLIGLGVRTIVQAR